MAYPLSRFYYCNGGNGTSTGYYAVATWPGTSQAVAAGAVCRQLAAPAVGNERIFACIVAGTTGASVEPTWVVTIGAKTTDGTATWIEVTGHAALNHDLTNAITWAAAKNTSVSLGVVIYDSVSGSVQVCSTAGTAGNGSQPSFSATAGVVTSDGATLKWTSLGLASNFAAWANPWARLNLAAASGNFMVGGETIYVSGNHTEAQASAVNYNQLGVGALSSIPVRILCVSDSAAPPTAEATGASVAATGNNGVTLGVNSSGALYVKGVSFTSGTLANAPGLGIGASPANSFGQFVAENCTFKLNGTGGGNYSVGSQNLHNSTFVIGCTFLFTATNQTMFSSNGGGEVGAQYIGCSFAPSGVVPSTLFALINSKQAVFRDCDFSGINTTLVAANNAGCTLLFEYCKLNASVVVVSGTGGAYYVPNIRLQNCDSSGTDYRYFYYTGACTIQQETTIVRSGTLATDGTTPLSWNFTTSALANYFMPSYSDELFQFNATVGIPITITAYLTTNATLTNKDFWIEAEFMGSSGSPLGVLTSTKCALLASPTTLTTDGSSSWGGGALTNKYKITLSITPQVAGPMKLRFYIAKPSVTVYADPYIYVS